MASEAEQHLATQVMAELVKDNENPITQINPAIIALLIELIPVIVEFIKACSDDDDATANGLNARAKEGRALDRAVLNLFVLRRIGFRAFREAGGRTLGPALMATAANDANVSHIEAILASAGADAI